MRSLLVTPVVLLAVVAVPAQIYPITAPEAESAITTRIHHQVHLRLHAGFSGETHCTGINYVDQEVTTTTQLAQWRCKLELRGVHFPRPCRAEANVFATSQPNDPRVQWLHETEFCHEGRAHWRDGRRVSSRR
jgi:hypothetical protein